MAFEQIFRLRQQTTKKMLRFSIKREKEQPTYHHCHRHHQKSNIGHQHKKIVMRPRRMNKIESWDNDVDYMKKNSVFASSYCLYASKLVVLYKES